MAHIIRRFVDNAIKNVFRAKNELLTLSGSDGIIKLSLPNGHTLGINLAEIPLYDRFLPSLASVTDKGIVDIGANVGDTMALVKAISRERTIIAVEPDKTFRDWLELNIKNNGLRNVLVYPHAISSEKCFVKVEKSFDLSTGNILTMNDPFSSDGIQTKTFAELISDNELQMSDLSIIKIDTDGFDWDCLLSLHNYLASHHIEQSQLPFIYYEHQTYLNNIGPSDSYRVEREAKYVEALKKLQAAGYTEYLIFDNFGSPMLRTSKIGDIEQLASYIRLSQLLNRRTTVYYLDILIFPSHLESLLLKAVDIHLKGEIVYLV